ncbi:type 1 glutamine amidotransferase domain-containing protein [Falsiroseomonas oryzae]|uniref:type 1 glutamine amidotransferase domain-containing protein n=1 Tax=Falsiroseomonas oryzae TaxID=2766473 RepID=UPI0022EB6574|nr:type 1 glutamine amidotransferase domain-containing protein [Roseomonas sp. MO-31]
MPKLLIVLTSHARLGDTGRATGFYWEELAAPYWAFRDAGIDVALASIAGGQPPADPTSLHEEASHNPSAVNRFLGDATAMAALRDTPPLEGQAPDDLVGIFIPGGHGTMWDLPESRPLAALVGALFEAGKPVGAVCHGPAGLVGARRADGRPVVEGRRVNGFTNAEEASAGLTDVMPFLLETRLRDLGGRFESGPDFAPFAIRDGNLVTGQNPASAEPAARHMLDAVRGR